MSDKLNRSDLLKGIGKTTTGIAAASTFGVEGVVADEDATVQEMEQRESVQNALQLRAELSSGGASEISASSTSTVDRSDGVKPDRSQFTKTELHLKNSRRTVVLERFTGTEEVLGNLDIGDLEIAVNKVLPESLGANFSYENAGASDSAYGNSRDRSASENPARGLGQGLTRADNGKSVTIFAKQDSSYAVRPLTIKEERLVEHELGISEFEAITHSDTDKIIATSEKGTDDDLRVRVYELRTDEDEPITNEVESVELVSEETSWKGGLSEDAIREVREGLGRSPNSSLRTNSTAITQGAVSAADQDCPDEAGYCAISGYMCIQEMAICGLCGSGCVISTVAWPGLAPCLACLLVVCSPAAWPQVGSCGTSIDCMLDIGSQYIDGNVELPDWYADSDFACR